VGWTVRGSIFGRSYRFYLAQKLLTGPGAQTASYLMGNRGYFARVKRLGREVDDSPPSCTRLKLTWPIYVYIHTYRDTEHNSIKHFIARMYERLNLAFRFRLSGRVSAAYCRSSTFSWKFKLLLGLSHRPVTTLSNLKAVDG
jgi:hypothetical protein